MFWNREKKKSKDDIELVLLKSTQEQYEFLTIKSILEENEIPYIVRNRGAGGYMRIATGMSFYPTDILVEESSFERAKKLLEEINL